ncbi:MAG TPA: hypothetical protein VLU43_00390 [Anaeromyxobacteraceae bacterium]|nr:hypothetical protein [Anaeromyxobacteraceae bacterium]
MRSAIAIVTLALAVQASADETRMKPFVLASRGPGEVEKVAEATRQKLQAAGLEVAGGYAPYPGAFVFAVSSDSLKAEAAKSEFGGYGAVQRVSATKVGDEVQVAYTNPLYMAAAYRMKGDLSGVAAALEGALGRIEEYGPSDGKTAKDLRGYHYMFGMEYFDEPSKLGKFDSHEAAVNAVAGGLAAGRGGATQVYRVELPGGKETVFGVALTEGCAGDASIMKEIDFKPVRSTGHLPYEVLVSGANVYALYARFRIAVNFPDLKMMGSNSFMNIRCAPGAIEESLRKVVGKEKE